MRTPLLAALGVLSLAGFVFGLLWDGGRVTVHFYLPNWGPVVAIDQALSHQDTRSPVATGMRLTIPTIAVDAVLEDLPVDADGQLQTPSRWEDAGWYDSGPRPGQGGIAVVVGHVDSHTGPAIFFRLHELKAGDPITVNEPDGTFDFRVASLASYSESAIPMDQIFVSRGPSKLALLTCAGDFNPLTGRYNDRLVVMASRA